MSEDRKNTTLAYLAKWIDALDVFPSPQMIDSEFYRWMLTKEAFSIKKSSVNDAMHSAFAAGYIAAYEGAHHD